MNNYFNNIKSSINFLVYNKKPLDLVFEYYGCMILSKKLNIPIYPWKNISSNLKNVYKFPIEDKGCDGASLDFCHLLQVKYYKKSKLTYRDLSTFLAFEKFSTKKSNKNLYLIRLEETRMTSDVEHIIKSGNIVDISINNDIFLQEINF